MNNYYIVIVIFFILYIFILPEKSNFTQLNTDTIIYIFTKKDCPACIYYKNHTHPKLFLELQAIYKNLKIEMVDNPEMTQKYNVTFFPNVVIIKNNKMRKLPMNKTINTENIIHILNAI